MINQTMSLTKSILKTSFYIDLALASIDTGTMIQVHCKGNQSIWLTSFNLKFICKCFFEKYPNCISL